MAIAYTRVIDELTRLTNIEKPSSLSDDPSMLMINHMMRASEAHNRIYKILAEYNPRNIRSYNLKVEYQIERPVYVPEDKGTWATWLGVYVLNVYRIGDRNTPIFTAAAPNVDDLLTKVNIVKLLFLFNS